jgi:hypothetical protein
MGIDQLAVLREQQIRIRAAERLALRQSRGHS